MCGEYISTVTVHHLCLAVTFLFTKIFRYCFRPWYNGNDHVLTCFQQFFSSKGFLIFPPKKYFQDPQIQKIYCIFYVENQPRQKFRITCRSMSCKSKAQVVFNSSRYGRILSNYKYFHSASLIISSSIKALSYLPSFQPWHSHLSNVPVAVHSSVCQAKMFYFLIAVKGLSLLICCTQNIAIFNYFLDISVPWFYWFDWF